MDVNLEGLELALQTGNEVIREAIGGRRYKLPFDMRYPDPVNNLDVQRLKELLEDGVRRNIEPFEGQNLGVFLSGGLDSSLVAFYAKIMFPDTKLTAFHMYYENPRTDEIEFARLVADKYDIPFVVVNTNHANQIANMETVTSLCSTMTMGIIPCYMGHQALGKYNIDAMLHGTLGDEMFGAWKIDKRYYDRKMSIFPKVRTSSKLARGLAIYFGTDKSWFCNNAFINTSESLTRSSVDLVDIYEECKESTLWGTTKHWQMQRMIGGKKVMDEPANIFGVNTVYPFLDKELLEYCFSIVPEQMYNKGPMRMIMETFYGMPAEIARRGEDWSVGGSGKVGLSPTDEFYTYDFLKHLLPNLETQYDVVTDYLSEYSKTRFYEWLRTNDRRGAQIALLMAYANR